jgi:hypothetical protein
VFDEVLADAVKLSQTGFMPLAEAAKTIGVGIADPVKGVEQLRQAGFALSPVLADTIRKMTEQGNVLGAQKLLLKSVSDQLGSVGNTGGLVGAYNQAKRAGTEFLEEIGGPVSQLIGVQSALNGIADALDRMTKASKEGKDVPGFIANLFKAGLPFGLGLVGYGVDLGLSFSNAGRDKPSASPKSGPGGADISGLMTEGLSGFHEGLDAANSFSTTLEQRRQQQKAIDDVVVSLKEELRVAGLNAIQQRADIALRQARTLATTADGRAIIGYVAAIHAAQDILRARQETQRQIDTMQVEANVIGLTATAAARYKYEQDLLNRAKEEGRTVGAAEAAIYKQLANQYGVVYEQLYKLQQQQKAVNDAVQGFGQLGYDALNGMIFEGKSLNDVFGNLLKTLGQMVLQASLLGSGPLAGILGFSSQIPGQTTGGLVGALAGGLFPRASAAPDPNAWSGIDFSTGFVGHTGAVIGAGGGPVRSIPSWMFAVAPRHHMGTPNLAPGEVPFIGMQGEEIGWPAQLAAKYGKPRQESVREGDILPNMSINIDATGAAPGAAEAIVAKLKKEMRESIIPTIIEAKKRRIPGL